MALSITENKVTRLQVQEIIDNPWDAQLLLKKTRIKKDNLKPLADAGDVNAQIVLLLGLTANAVDEIWTEEFEDENTHKMVPMERYSFKDVPLFAADPGEVEELKERLFNAVNEQSDSKQLYWKSYFIREFSR